MKIPYKDYECGAVLRMHRETYLSNPKKYKKVFKGAIEFDNWNRCSVFFYCIKIVMPGSRFYFNNNDFNMGGTQGVESLNITSKEMREFFKLFHMTKKMCKGEELINEIHMFLRSIEEVICEALGEENFWGFLEGKDGYITRFRIKYLAWVGAKENLVVLQQFIFAKEHFINYTNKLRGLLYEKEESLP